MAQLISRTIKFCCFYCENTLLQQLGPSSKADSLWCVSFFRELNTALHSLQRTTARSSVTAEVRRSVTGTRLPGASLQCWSGGLSKANSNVCHCQQIYHTLAMLLWKLNLGPRRSQGFCGVDWQRLSELTCTGTVSLSCPLRSRLRMRDWEPD